LVHYKIESVNRFALHKGAFLAAAAAAAADHGNAGLAVFGQQKRIAIAPVVGKVWDKVFPFWHRPPQ
jgi:hypothetical protein